MRNTIKTTAGYLLSLVSRYSPIKRTPATLGSIYNYLPIHDTLSTSGQPTEHQFTLIKNAGFTHIINLAPHHAENALPDEAGLLRRLDLAYHHIPVNFQAPEEERFQQFVTLMEQLKQEKVWLHCAANMRASAFLYRYRRDVLNENADQARQTMKKIWEPFGAWKDFLK